MYVKTCTERSVTRHTSPPPTDIRLKPRLEKHINNRDDIHEIWTYYNRTHLSLSLPFLLLPPFPDVFLFPLPLPSPLPVFCPVVLLLPKALSLFPMPPVRCTQLNSVLSMVWLRCPFVPFICGLACKSHPRKEPTSVPSMFLVINSLMYVSKSCFLLVTKVSDKWPWNFLGGKFNVDRRPSGKELCNFKNWR